jgi:Flp pilus assembly protein TadG
MLRSVNALIAALKPYNISSQLRVLKKARRGTVGIIFGLALVPVMAIIGVSLDYSRVSHAKIGLANALDAGVLALANQPGLTQDNASEILTSYVESNAPSYDNIYWNIKSVTLSPVSIKASLDAKIKTAALGIMGVDEVHFSIENEVVRELTDMEVVLVLDNTGSMNGGNKIGALRDAAMDLVEKLEEVAPETSTIKIGLVPFVTAVNIKTDPNLELNGSLIDTQGHSSIDFSQFDPATSGPAGPKNNLALFATMGVPWKGCVQARPEPYDIDDTPPSPSNPDTLFVPYLWPDEPDGDSDYNNNYLADGVTGSNEKRQQNVAKYLGANPSVDEIPSDTSGPNKSCADPLLPLTDNIDLVKTRIQEMRAWNNSGTVISEGMAWGWRVLSPGEPFTQGRPYNDQGTRKIMVVLTDGENQIWGGWDGHNKSDYTSYGYLAEGRLGTNNDQIAKGIINQKVETVCNRVKDVGIEVYTVTFKVNGRDLQNLFKRCASRPDMAYHSNSNGELVKVFGEIAMSMSKLRLTK